MAFVLLVMLLFPILFFGGVWLFVVFHGIFQAEAHLPVESRRWLVTVASGIPALLLQIALLLTIYVGFPLMALFLLLWLPGFCYLVLSSAVYYALWSPVLLWHYLHYLFVPHPAETAYRTGMARRVPLPQLAADVADAMYQYDLRDYDRLPRAWRSRNWQRRIEAFHRRIRAEDDFMQELERHIRLRDQFRE